MIRQTLQYKKVTLALRVDCVEVRITENEKKQDRQFLSCFFELFIAENYLRIVSGVRRMILSLTGQEYFMSITSVL